MRLSAEIKGLRYSPTLCRNLESFDFEDIENAFEIKSSFILRYNGRDSFAVSWWVSPKRTRSYPYARVYDTLSFPGKKVTVIPVIKDEGKGGDRDFLQWDTISLMSLLGVYVVLAHYTNAEKSSKYPNKITNQRFDYSLVRRKLKEIFVCQSDALHWNLREVENIGTELKSALDAYDRISRNTGVELHSRVTAEKRLTKILQKKDAFLSFSRKLAEEAQSREVRTIQPKEKTEGKKAAITIKNYLGGYYYFTCDEAKIKEEIIYIKECKHTKNSFLPSLEDIKDGLLKMVVFTNLETVLWGPKRYKAQAVLKLTRKKRNSMGKREKDAFLSSLEKEARINNFQLETVEV